MKTKAEKYLDDNNIEIVIVELDNLKSIQVHQNGKQTSMEQVLAGFANSLTEPLSKKQKDQVKNQNQIFCC